MAKTIPSQGIEAFAMIVDINGYAKMVSNENAGLIAQHTRDILIGGIEIVEKNGGDVIGLMGDAFLAILYDPVKVYVCCYGIAKDIDSVCEYLSKDPFPSFTKAPSLKISIEYGHLNVSDITSKFLGTQAIFAGVAINYAHRISRAGSGNRCHIGPAAYDKGLKQYFGNDDQCKISGKPGEDEYSYYKLDLSDIWREGDSNESYWG